MKKYLLILYTFIFQTTFSQNKSFTLETSDYLGLQKFNWDDRIMLNVIENNSIYFFSGNLKVLYLKDYKTVITLDSLYKYYTFSEAFGNGFVKDGKTKTIYGKPAERYSLSTLKLDLHLWVSDGAQEKNDFFNSLDSLGIISQIPKNKAIVAIEYKGIENDLNEIIYDKDGRRKGAYLNYFLGYAMKDTSITNCYERNKKAELPINDIKPDGEVSFKFKTNNLITYSTEYRNRKDTLGSIEYLNETDNQSLVIQQEENKDGNNAYYFDRKAGLSFKGKLSGQTFLISEMTRINTNSCEEWYPAKFITKETDPTGTLLSYYIRCKKNDFHIILYCIDESTPAYKKIANNLIIKELPNGLTLNIKRMYEHLEEYYTEVKSIETGNFTFKFKYDK